MLPEELTRRLEEAKVDLGGRRRSLLELLREYEDYRQFKDAQGEWDRPALRSTLLAMSLAARYLLMQENAFAHAQATVEELQPKGVATLLSPEDFHPGESFAIYFGKKADAEKKARLLAEEEAREAVRKADAKEKAMLLAEEKARENARKADEAVRKADEAVRKADENARMADENARMADENARMADEAVRNADAAIRELRLAEEEKREAIRLAEELKSQADENARQAVAVIQTLRLAEEEQQRKAEETVRAMVMRRRQKGHTNAEIADDLGCTEEELLAALSSKPLNCFSASQLCRSLGA